MLGGVANDRPFLVSDASSWIYAGTGLHTYTGNGTNRRRHERREPERAAGHGRLRVRLACIDHASPRSVRELGSRRSGDARALVRPRGGRKRHQYVERRDGVHGSERRRDGLLGRHDPVVVGPRSGLRERLLRLRAGRAVREHRHPAGHGEHHQPPQRAVAPGPVRSLQGDTALRAASRVSRGTPAVRA